MSWDSAGAFVWHPTAIDPELLGRELRANGFGWAAVFVQDGTAEAPLDPAWIDKFRRSSGLPLGGWGVLRSDPVHEADLVHRIVDQAVGAPFEDPLDERRVPEIAGESVGQL